MGIDSRNKNLINDSAVERATSLSALLKGCALIHSEKWTLSINELHLVFLSFSFTLSAKYFIICFWSFWIAGRRMRSASLSIESLALDHSATAFVVGSLSGGGKSPASLCQGFHRPVLRLHQKVITGSTKYRCIPVLPTSILPLPISDSISSARSSDFFLCSAPDDHHQWRQSIFRTVRCLFSFSSLVDYSSRLIETSPLNRSRERLCHHDIVP